MRKANEKKKKVGHKGSRKKMAVFFIKETIK